jgi:arginine decarboxylase
MEDYLELHLSILRGIEERFDTPFFDALREYSQRPTGVFHAMPISRGKSIAKSHWIRDMGDFYGPNIFLAETSATTGGLDSLLQPTGPLKVAQEKTARAFGSDRSYFVTNGTSTANKIVMQALVRPGDIVLVSRDCHKSHHYSLVLAGASPVYMDPYPLKRYSMYGAVTLRTIKERLLALQRAGKLDRVRMLLLTNCTFDGIVYDPATVMREVLAIKPDMIFVWDEAWFAFARFSPTYRSRTAMETAAKLRAELRSPEYTGRYAEWRRVHDAKDPNDDSTWLDSPLLPDPELTRTRVYATQSTHKTLTSLRQGSMIHISDQDFERVAERMFDEAFMTHTSTSPNYQILASLDVGRRQVELEGYELVKESVELAMTLRERITEQPLLQKWFDVVSVGELIPEPNRPSGMDAFYSVEGGFRTMEHAWDVDEFALDPTRVTLYVGKTGIDGDTFRKLLHEKYDIQVNKTSRNTVLFMLNIGTTRGTVAYLLEVLTKIARGVEEDHEQQSAMDAQIDERRIDALTNRQPDLPNFTHFHRSFTHGAEGTPEGDMRTAFFMAYDGANCEYLRLGDEVIRAVQSDREVVSASFVTPYPPGFPILVPGQVVTEGVLHYLAALDVKEIHGYEPEHGLRVFTEKALAKRSQKEPMARVGSATRMEALQ